jgi:hypothetical protein
VHDAKRFKVDQILDVAFNSNGTGLLFKVRWPPPFNVPSEDTWEPMRGVNHLSIAIAGQISQSLACKNPQEAKNLSNAQRGRWY